MHKDVPPDYRRTVDELHNEYQDCARCDLGDMHRAHGDHMVKGEGAHGGIMFIGDAARKEESAVGRPFIGQPGRILRRAIEHLGLDRYYLTNIVACRSCAQAVGNDGHLRYRKEYNKGAVLLPVIQDRIPLPVNMQACMSRLHHEIYTVDPILIVALGVTAASALIKRKLSLQDANGSVTSISIAGAGRQPILSPTNGTWARVVRGDMYLPHKQSTVEYPMVTVIHPLFVASNYQDERRGNPLQLFTEGMRVVAQVYDRYLFEVYGDNQTKRSLSEQDMEEVIVNGQ